MTSLFFVVGLCLLFDAPSAIPVLVEQGKYAEAEAALQGQLQTAQNPTDRARILLQLVEVYRQSGRPSLAHPLINEAVQIASLHDDMQLRARALHSLAFGLVLRGRTQEADAEFRRALAYAPTASRERLEILNNYTMFLVNDGRLTNVEDYLKEALQLVEGLPSPARAAVLLTFARLRFHQNRFDEANRMLLQAEDGLSDAKAGALRGEILNLQGLIASSQGARKQAEATWRSSSAFYKGQPARFRTWPHGADPLLNLAELLRGEGRLAEALAFATEAEAFLSNLPEPVYHQQAEVQNMLGCIHADAKRWREARKARQQALAFYRKTSDPQCEHAGGTLLNLAFVAWTQHAYAESADLLAQAEPILSRPEVQKPIRGIHLSLQAKVARKLGNKSQAAALEQQAIALQEPADRYKVSVQALREK